MHTRELLLLGRANVQGLMPRQAVRSLWFMRSKLRELLHRVFDMPTKPITKPKSESISITKPQPKPIPWHC